ncbi:hypothetical protein [Streptomyces sp. NBC_01334]|uniref:hypothetical protein n=1 Tax=Streptomyces sp. NBC_01334 TaxID=2903827 RepID=UPI002E114245|nr:hypothetical protein OG736_00760 [Streptomyces sp. NBC_01334]
MKATTPNAPEQRKALMLIWCGHSRPGTPPTAPRARNVTALRRCLLRLSVRLWWHPYWTQGRAGREELRCRGRALERQR